MFATSAWAADAKKGSDPPDLELQTGVSCNPRWSRELNSGPLEEQAVGVSTVEPSLQPSEGSFLTTSLPIPRDNTALTFMLSVFASWCLVFGKYL